MTAEPPVTIKQLAAFLTIAEAGSIRRAAEIGGTSQPALSAQLAALERELQVALFERRSNGMQLTPDGREMMEMARQVIDAANDIAALRSRDGGRIDASVAIGVSSSIGPYVLLAATPSLHSSYPGLRLKVREGTTRALTRDLLDGAHDLILTQLPLSDQSLRHEVVAIEPLYLLMAADNDLASKARIGLEDLAGRRFLTLGQDFALTAQVQRLCADAKASVSDLYEGNSMDALRIMCAMSDNLALVPEFYVRSEVQGDEAVAVRRLERQNLRRSIVVAWRQSLGKPAFVTALHQAIAETAKRLSAKPLALAAKTPRPAD